ncbi:MAG: hypothetical protein ABSB32_10235 [Thermodesulfobacteriota bacterium]|jgi:predicted Ser/Thr protein kinase
MIKKLLEKVRGKVENEADELKRLQAEGKIPKAYSESKPIPLSKFLHGRELINQLEKNRELRREWARNYFGIKDSEEEGEKEPWDE